MSTHAHCTPIGFHLWSANDNNVIVRTGVPAALRCFSAPQAVASASSNYHSTTGTILTCPNSQVIRLYIGVINSGLMLQWLLDRNSFIFH